ncbi:MAG TPA: molecular chaperone DnaJ [Acidimicrobiales bacterium]|nr:molecular chaperone DnaJ [Acidimicrobiales bacterium]
MAPQREWLEKDYYKVLGVAKTATDKEIARAYRKLAKQYHPDANPGSEERFKEISAAYEVVGDEAKRKEYDEVRAMGAPGFAGNPFAGAGAPGGFSNFRVDDLGDILGNIFGRGGRRARQPQGAGATPAGPQKGQDVEAELHLSFADAVQGVTTTVNVVSDVPCATCSGTGSAPGTAPTVCAVCSGTGVVNENQGMFSFSHPCVACGGTGMQIETPCPTCAGRGTERKARQVKVRIPSGVEDGQRIKVKGRGGAGRHGAPAGDLFVTVRTTAHSVFGRRGNDLTVKVPITFAEAALGATIPVPTLSGRTVTMKVPPGTPSGRQFRVAGQGVPLPGHAGDLIVSVEVDVPSHLNAEQRRAVEALSKASGEDGDRLREHLGAVAR